jgi:hypothetical protein
MVSRGECMSGFAAVAVLLSSSTLLAQAPAPPDAADESLPPPPAAPPGIEVEPALTPAPPRSVMEPERAWYGWQLLINDFVALGTIGGAAVAGVHGSDAYAVIIPAAIVYDLGGPTIHWLHQRKAIAGASFGIRAGVPLVGVLFGAVVGSCGDDGSTAAKCRSRGAGYGALGGFAAATAIDAAGLAWDAPVRPRRAVETGLAWTPLLLPRHGGATLDVVGAF